MRIILVTGAASIGALAGATLALVGVTHWIDQALARLRW